MYHYSFYWGAWSRVLLEENHLGTLTFVEVDLTPVGDSWGRVAETNIRKHSTPRDIQDKVVSELPKEVWERMVARLGLWKANYLINHNFLMEINWSLYERHCYGGASFDFIKQVCPIYSR